MASPLALSAVCEAVVKLLDDTAAIAPPVGFAVATDYAVVGPNTISTITNGGGIFPYRVSVNGTYRRPPGTTDISGRRRQTKLPVDLHFLVMVVATDESTKMSLTGWIMRTLEDHPVLPIGLLNHQFDAFAFGELVEISFVDAPHEELLHLREVIGAGAANSFVMPYAARAVSLESELDEGVFADVQERELEFGVLKERPAR